MSSQSRLISFSKTSVNIDSLQCLKKKTNTLEFQQCLAENWVDISKYLIRYTAITSLSLVNCQTDDEITKVISKMTQLVNLNLDGNRICDKGVERLASLTNLKRISLQRNPRVKPHSLAFLTNGIRGLTYISMKKECEQLEISHIYIGDIGIKLICPNLLNIKSLSLWNTAISVEGCISISRLLMTLESFSVCFNTSGDQGAIAISRNLLNIKNLDLRCCSMTLLSMMELVKNLRKLHKLKILQKPYSIKGRYRLHIKSRLKAHNHKVHIQI